MRSLRNWIRRTNAARFGVLALPIGGALTACSIFASSDFSDLLARDGSDAQVLIAEEAATADATCSESTCSDVGTSPTDSSATLDATDDPDSTLPAIYVFQKSTTYDGLMDTTLDEDKPTTNYAASLQLSIDHDNPTGTGRSNLALIRFDISAITPGRKVIAATLSFTVNNSSSGSVPFEVFPLLRAWSSKSATWNTAIDAILWTAPGARGVGTDRAAISLATLLPKATGPYDIVFSSPEQLALIQAWVDAPASNFGVVIDTANNGDGLALDSSDTSTAANRPRLTVTIAAP